MQPFYAQAVAGLSAFDKSKFSDEEKKRARILADEGVNLWKSEKGEEGVLKLIESYATFPDPGVALLIAGFFDQKGEKKQALSWYFDFLEENDPAYARFFDRVKERIYALQRTNWILPVAIGSAALLVVFAFMKKSSPSVARA